MEDQPGANPYESPTGSKARRFLRMSSGKWMAAHLVVILLYGGLVGVGLILRDVPVAWIFDEWGIWGHALMFVGLSITIIGLVSVFVIPVGFAITNMRLQDKLAEQKRLIAIEVAVTALHLFLLYCQYLASAA